MTAFIGVPPPLFVIPVTLGADFVFTLLRQDSNGVPVDWNGAVVMQIQLVKTNPSLVQASVSGNAAKFVIANTICDEAHTSGTTWQIVYADAETSPVSNVAIAVGMFARYDGQLA